MITTHWFGACPKCGSHNISSYTWAIICNDCGYIEWAQSIGERTNTSEKYEDTESYKIRKK